MSKKAKITQEGEKGQGQQDHHVAQEDQGQNQGKKKKKKKSKKKKGADWPAGERPKTMTGAKKQQQGGGVTKEQARQAAIEQALPHWLAHPHLIEADIAGGLEIEELQQKLLEQNHVEISARTLEVLRSQDIERFFPVQGVVIPAMMKDATTFSHPGDLCVSAPTGSGKTLAYAIPIVEVLAKRVVTRLRALILLPTRELVAQVFETFTMLAAGTDLKILSATGHTRFHHEQRQLVSQLDMEFASLFPLPFSAVLPFSLILAHFLSLLNSLPGGDSLIDILIATPGRLVDHISSTRNFTLQHLRFLVIDEADRLLNQSYHDWLTKVLQAATTTIDPSDSVQTDDFGYFASFLLSLFVWLFSFTFSFPHRIRFLS